MITKSGMTTRITEIDVFIGGPADGKMIPVSEDGRRRGMMFVAEPTPEIVRWSPAEFWSDKNTFVRHAYRTETLFSRERRADCYVTFWISQDLTCEQALIKLATNYKPALALDEHHAPVG